MLHFTNRKNISLNFSRLENKTGASLMIKRFVLQVKRETGVHKDKVNMEQ